MKHVKDFNQLPINLSLLLVEAKKRKYKIEYFPNFSKQKNDLFHILNPLNGNEMVVTGVNNYSDQPMSGTFLAEHKFLTYKLLKSNQIKTPKTFKFKSVFEAEKNWKKQFGKKPVVLKPENSGMGADVFLKVDNSRDLKKFSKTILKKHQKIGLIQEFFKGDDLRIQVVSGKVVAACTRVAANVVGDGKKNIKLLIEEKNKARRAFNPDNIIKVDSETKALIKEQGHSLGSVLEKDLTVRLKKATNVGLGGEPIDLTQKLHSKFEKFIEKLSKIFLVKTFAVDLIITKKSNKIQPENTVLLEINAPCLWAHHHIASGQKRNVAAAILDANLNPKEFNPTSKKYLIN